MPLSIVILAAGKGSRMKSNRPKVIHRLAGKPLVQQVIDSCRHLDPEQIVVVVGHEAEQVRETLAGADCLFVEQREQLGTGHAVQQALPAVTPGNDLLVLYGDVPLIRAQTLQQLRQQAAEHGSVVCLLSFIAEDPTGYGRIVRDETGSVTAIVEEKDASDDIRRIRESNSGILMLRGDQAAALLAALDNDNAQQEYYLTDTVRHAVARQLPVHAVICDDEEELLGVNNQRQLARLEAILRRRRADALMDAGVKLADPRRVDIRGELRCGMDVEIDVNCVFEGSVELGDGVRIGANCHLKNVRIAAGSELLPNCVLEDCVLGTGNSIGPFARIRPGTETADAVKVGNFVEIKKSRIGRGSKVNHLAYVGDTEMGERVNVGAGAITCNYDGAYKHQTIIGDDVFVGSDVQLVAPVRIGSGATIGAGATITRDAPAGELTLSRAKQTTIKGWKRPSKQQGD